MESIDKVNATLWILLDVSNCMRGATIESARNVLQQYILGPLSGSSVKVSLVTFANTSKLVTASPVDVDDFKLPTLIEIGGLCNLSQAIRHCTSDSGDNDKILVLTKGYTTDSKSMNLTQTDLESFVLMLDTISDKAPQSLKSYFTNVLHMHNMKDESLSELSNNLVSIFKNSR